MQKLNELGVELQALKQELLKTDYPDVVKKALFLSAEDKVKNNIIDVDLHLSLTDQECGKEDFTAILFDVPTCMKTKEEMLVEFEKIREGLQAKLDEAEIPTDITSKSLVETEQLSFTKTFKLDKQWVSDYFGQPAEEVSKLMVRNGFIEKFAVLRLSKILEDFMKSEHFEGDAVVDCKATRVFYDVENSYYGVHVIFYMGIEQAEDEEISTKALDYIQRMNEKVVHYMDERMKI